MWNKYRCSFLFFSKGACVRVRVCAGVCVCVCVPAYMPAGVFVCAEGAVELYNSIMVVTSKFITGRITAVLIKVGCVVKGKPQLRQL